MPRPNPNTKLSHELIPDELWSRVCTSLDCRALRSLCCSSTRMLRIARPVLYEDVVLIVDWCLRPNSGQTIDLLKSDTKLAQYVLSLVVYFSFNNLNTHLPTALDPALLEKLTRLRAVTLKGDVFNWLDKETVERIVALSEGLSLQRLTIDVPRTGHELSEAQLARIGSKLHSLEIYDVARSVPELPLLMLKNSSSSLTTISFLLDLSEPSHDTMLNFFSTTFPYLRSLTLGIWYPTPTQFVEFIVRHSANLETLCLGYNPHEEDATAFPAEGQELEEALAKVTPDTLSKLQTFQGKTSCLRFMALAKLRCLETMTSVCTGSGESQSGGFGEGWQEMYGAFQASSIQCLGSVKELFFDTTDWITGKQHATDNMGTMAELCGRTLEVWNGGLPALMYDGWSTRDLRKMFGRFPQLRVLYLRELPTGEDEEDDLDWEQQSDEQGDSESEQDGEGDSQSEKDEEGSDEEGSVEEGSDEEDGDRRQSETGRYSSRTVKKLAKTLPFLERVYRYNWWLEVVAGWEIGRQAMVSGSDSTSSDSVSVSAIDPVLLPRELDNSPVGLTQIVENY